MDLEFDFKSFLLGVREDAPEAWRLFESQYQKMMLSWASSVVGRNQAEDIVQDVKLSLLRSKSFSTFSGASDDDLRRWLWTVVRNRAISFLKSGQYKNRPETLQDWQAADESTAAELKSNDSDLTRRTKIVKDCMSRLTPKKRQAIELMLEGKSVQEAAAAMKIEVSKVYVYRSEAKKALKNCAEGKSL